MPMATQLALSTSVELTKLFPGVVRLLNESVETLIQRTIDLKASRSDLITEETLGDLFGRVLIDSKMEGSFRTVVGKGTKSQDRFTGIILEWGPGPTVKRAFENPAYLPMVIQCSFLTWIHKRTALAEAIVFFFEKDAEQLAQAGKQPSWIIPSHQDILGCLQACEEQTAAYYWTAQLTAVAATLGIEPTNALSQLPAVILRGALQMFPLVQRFPEEHEMIVDMGPDGLCPLIVWAVHILALRLLVKLDLDDNYREISFGEGLPQVIINTKRLEPRRPLDPAVTRLSKDGEKLTLMPVDDESPISARGKTSAKGFGRKFLSKFMHLVKNKEGTMNELILMAVSFATNISEGIVSEYIQGKRQCVVIDKTPPPSTRQMFDDICCLKNKGSLLIAARIFFDTPIDEDSVDDRRRLHKNDPLGCLKKPPREISLALDRMHGSENQGVKDFVWDSIREALIIVALLVLAFAHIRDLDSYEDIESFILCDTRDLKGAITRLDLFQALKSWKGGSQAHISAETWFKILAILISGEDPKQEFDRAALVSDSGWSIIVETYDDQLDPICCSPGLVVVKRGVPCRNGVRKDMVIDGLTAKCGGTKDKPATYHHAGDKVALSGVQYPGIQEERLGNTFIGESPNCFLISIRLIHDTSRRAGEEIVRGLNTERTGHREWFDSIWGVQKSIGCQHKLVPGEVITLEPDWATVVLDNHATSKPVRERLLFCLTTEKYNRWKSLILITRARNHPENADYRGVILRDPNCCISCVIDQALLRGGKWYIIL